MKCPVITFDNKTVGEIELDEAVFGVTPRKDILARMVNWQLAKRRAGTHKANGISDDQIGLIARDNAAAMLGL